MSDEQVRIIDFLNSKIWNGIFEQSEAVLPDDAIGITKRAKTLLKKNQDIEQLRPY